VSAWTDDLRCAAEVVLSPRPAVAVPAAGPTAWRGLLCRTLSAAPFGPSDDRPLAAQFSTLIMRDIPQMNEDTKDAARRFGP